MRGSGCTTLLLALSALAGESQSQDLATIQKKGSLRVLVDRSNLPERFDLGNGPEPGLEKEILLGFAALHGVKLEVAVVDRSEDRIRQLVEGSGDVIAGIVVTESRRKLVNFTAAVLPSRHVVLTRRPDKVVSTLEELRALRVGTMKGTSWNEEARAAGVPAANLDESYTSPEGLLEALVARRVSATVMTVVWAVVERKKDPQLQLGLFIGPPSSVAFAVRKDSPKLWTALDGYVTNLRRTATWSRLVVKYFGEDGLEILKKSRPE